MNPTKGPANSKNERKLSLRPTIDKMIETKPNRRKIYPMTVNIGLSIREKHRFRANVDNNAIISNIDIMLVR